MLFNKQCSNIYKITYNILTEYRYNITRECNILR